MPWKPKTHAQRLKEARGGDKQRHRDYEQRRKADPALALSKKIRNSRKWQLVREQVKRAHPLCWLCKQQGMVVPMDSVHHIQPLTKHPELAFTWSNLVPLCTPCHNRVDGQENQGKPQAHRFEGWDGARLSSGDLA